MEPIASKAASTRKETVSQSAFKVMLGGSFSLVAGLASQIIVASIFGAGTEMDAFLTALVVPSYLCAVLCSGLIFVVVPAFVKEEAAGREEDAWALVGTFFWLTVGILMAVAFAGSLTARNIIDVTAPGLSPGKAELSARMLSVLMFTVPLTGLGSLTEGIQNVRSSFFWPAAARAIGSVGNVIVLLALYRALGSMALAWGNLVAVALAASLPLVPVLRHGWTKRMPLYDSRMLEMARLITPFVLFGLFTRSTSLFERFFASELPDGDLSYLGYAYKISSILVLVLATSIASPIFPAMARTYAENGEQGLTEQAEYGFRLSLAIALPALAILGGVAVPLVTVLYERGAFQHADALNVSRILLIVMIGDVLFRMLGNVIGRTFYVLKDTYTYPTVTMITVGLYIFLARVLADAWGYVGLALATPLQMGLAILVVCLLLLRKMRAFHLGEMFRDLILYASAGFAAFLVARLSSSAVAFLPAILQLIIGFALAGLVYLAILFWVDRDITVSILEMAGLKQIYARALMGVRHSTEMIRG